MHVMADIAPTDTEGGAKSWARPNLPTIDENKDNIGRHSL